MRSRTSHAFCAFLVLRDDLKRNCSHSFAMFNITTFLHEQIVQKPSHEKKQMLTPQSKVVADKVAKLVHSAEALKGKKKCRYSHRTPSRTAVVLRCLLKQFL